MSAEVRSRKPIDDESAWAAEDHGQPSLREYCVRVPVLFDSAVVGPAGSPSAIGRIIIRPTEQMLLGRIVMHKSITRHLILEKWYYGPDDARAINIGSGSGTCEIFAYDIPNWTPQRIILNKNSPMTMIVRNEFDRPLRLVGTTILYRKLREDER